MADSDSSSDDEPRLSAQTLAALHDFCRERYENEQKSDQDKDIDENWGLSQFWYDDETALTLAKEVLRATNNGRICCLCAPSLYKKLRKIKPEGCEVVLFEYDRRFKVYGKDFVFYDVNDPLTIPPEVPKNSFDLVFADPPYLNEECFTKVSKTVNYLMKDKVMFCTGLKMKDLLKSLYNAEPTKFLPKHKKNLMNAFHCFTNYESHLN